MDSEDDVQLVQELLSVENENVVPLHHNFRFPYPNSGHEKKKIIYIRLWHKFWGNFKL